MSKVRFKRSRPLAEWTVTSFFPNVIEDDFYDNHPHIWAQHATISAQITYRQHSWHINGVREACSRVKTLTKTTNVHANPTYMQYLPGQQFAWTILCGHYIMLIRPADMTLPLSIQILPPDSAELWVHPIFSQIKLGEIIHLSANKTLPYSVCGVLVGSDYMHTGTVEHDISPHIMLPFKANLFGNAPLKRVEFSDNSATFPLSIGYTHNWTRCIFVDPAGLYGNYRAYLNDMPHTNDPQHHHLMCRYKPGLNSYTDFVTAWNTIYPIDIPISAETVKWRVHIVPCKDGEIRTEWDISPNSKTGLIEFVHKLPLGSVNEFSLIKPVFPLNYSPVTRSVYHEKYNLFRTLLSDLVVEYENRHVKVLLAEEPT